MILDGSQASAIETAAQALHQGNLLAFPTETVYGLGADAGNDAAVAKIFAAKGRPAEHPLIVHVAQASSVNYFASEVPAFARALIKAFWPGPLTLILPRRPAIAAAAAAGQNSIGLRCPSHPVAQALLRACSELGVAGVAAPSANQFGRVSPTTAAHVAGEFDESLLILDGGPCQVGIESTIVDCTRGAPILLRPGAITLAQLQAACETQVLAGEGAAALQRSAPRASGTLESHYAPHAKLRLMDAASLQAALNMMGKDLDQGKATIAIYARTLLRIASSKLLFRRMPDDAAATAQQLFAVLREFDAQGIKLIWVETPPDAPEWAGVADRLSRAAA